MVYEIILGGLLHDIGKFMQRACDGFDGLSSQSRGMEESLCPVYEGRHSHYHVLFTNEFCEKHLSALPRSLNRSTVANLAAYHHKPSDDTQRIIQDADRLSSGMDRREDDSPSGPQDFRKKRLISILSTITLDESAQPARWNHALAPLDPTNVFPVAHDGANTLLNAEYRALWDSFISQWNTNQVEDPWGYVNRALSVLEQYAWCIPSATNVTPDIPLYDHMKTTAAIAACLHLSGNQDAPFLLVQGDYSGIQDYILDIQKKGAGGYAKRLRARSFFVSLLSEAVSLKMLRALDLPLTQRILFAGGKFLLLLPNSDTVKKTVTGIRSEIDRWLLDATSGDIRFSMASMETGKEGILDFSSTLDHITNLLRDDKNSLFRSVLQEGGQWSGDTFLGPRIIEDELSSVCAACGKRTGSDKLPGGESEDRACPSCSFDFHLGTGLPRAKCVIFSSGSDAHEIIPGISVELSPHIPAKADPAAFLVRLLTGGIPEDAPVKVPVSGGFVVNVIPRDDSGETLTFDKIGEQSTGAPFVAYLKGDVDNLGLIFKEGFRDTDEKTSHASISRLATLSRTLEVFFSGHIRRLLETEKRFKHIYTVYSGGDDFLCLGPWDVMIDFAERLRDDFRKFTAGNPAWSLSMGYALAGRHTPVLEGVGRADELLEFSKVASGGGILPVSDMISEIEPSKDRITAFGTSIPFPIYPPVLDHAREVSSWLGDGVLSSSHVWRLRRYAELYRSYQETNKTEYLEYIPLLAYELRRNWKDIDKTPEGKKAKDWAASLGAGPDVPDMKALKFICEYAILSHRDKKDE